ncbi:MAG: fatty acid kinase fatty acid binding subunit [Micromonosporaceae bacterium]|jgi:DegV family protein with EDD domain|nr:fatty acid kinase fatty acid binding subunit [Micromonosporaceae bacterium]
MTGTPERIAVVTDSTAYLPDALVTRFGLTIIALTVVIAGEPGLEGVDVTPADVAKALGVRRTPVTTSRPAPSAFIRAYQQLFDAGVTGVVSVHLSAKLSGTYQAAGLAAERFGGRVEVVDSGSTGMGLGFPALAAATAAGASDATLTLVREAAIAAVGRTTTLFYVDTLEFLRRGGRIGTASALLGTALSVKPILRVADGAIEVSEKVRTASRALDRLVELAADAAGDSRVDIAVHHLVATERADALHRSLVARLGERLRTAYTTEVGGAVAAHVGPGLAGVVVHRL